MADFTKAGSDKGDFEKQLKHHLISANYMYYSYMQTIDDMEKDELEVDLQEYIEMYNTVVLPMVSFAEDLGEEKWIKKANEIKGVYEKLIEEIKKKIESF